MHCEQTMLSGGPPTLVAFHPPHSDFPSVESPLLHIVLLLLLTIASSRPISTSPPSLVDSNSDNPLPLQPLASGVLELLLPIEPRILGARSIKIVRTIGRLALMMHKQGSRVDHKIAIARVKVGSANEIFWTDVILIIETAVILLCINRGLLYDVLTSR